jgi:hypothetical protein
VRTAVIFSGQTRGSDYFLDNLQRLSGLNPVGFISVWERQGVKAEGWMGRNQLKRVLGDEIASLLPESLVHSSKLPQLIPEFFEELKQRHEIFKPSFNESAIIPLIDVELDNMFNPDHRGPGDISSARILYKVRRCLNYILAYESSCATKFSHFMRLRPDCKVISSSLLPEIPGDGIAVDFISDGSTGRQIGDNLIFATRDTFLQLVDSWEHAVFDLKISGIHSVLDHCFTANNFTAYHSPIDVEDCVGKWPLDLLYSHLERKRMRDIDASAFCDLLKVFL